jgi:hypothetical protein
MTPLVACSPIRLLHCSIHNSEPRPSHSSDSSYEGQLHGRRNETFNISLARLVLGNPLAWQAAKARQCKRHHLDGAGISQGGQSVWATEGFVIAIPQEQPAPRVKG